jgi:alpha-galactosidase
MKAALSSLVLAAILASAGCSDSGSTTAHPKGGAGGGSGGASASGGSTGSGGTSPTGGTTARGGTTGSGGATETASRTGTGGTPATGGDSGTGGASPTGGKTGSGGRSATGGGNGTGGGGGSTTGAAGSGGAAAGGSSGGLAGSGSGGAAAGGSSGSGGRGGTAGRDGAAPDSGSTGGTDGSIPVGSTPPMGWNSWNKFGSNVSEKLVKSVADAVAKNGMKDAGYQYINIDDCWMDGRDSGGKLKANASTFPSGIAALADYIHNLGLKIGIYSTPNTQTCAAIYGGCTGGVGSKGHETTDAQTFASWGIDYLKYDKCRGDMGGFAVMRDALRATGRPIFYSINPADQGPYCTPTSCSIDVVKIASMWRIEFDIGANWSSVVRLIDKNKPEYVGAGPGHWNDPDMLEVGNGLSDLEGRAHFGMWAIMAAPLITGNDVTSMTAATKATLLNKEVIAVDQDLLGKQGRVVATPGSSLEVWSKELAGTNTRAVALFNRSSASASITVKWSDIGIPAGAATIRDLWAGKDLGSFTDTYTATNVASHDVAMLKVVSTP